MPIGAEISNPGSTVHVDFRQIVETVGRRADVVVPDESVRIAQLQVAHDFLIRLEPRLVRHHPGCSGRWEEAPAMGFMETLRPIVAEIELCEIAFVEAVSETSRKPGVPGRQGELEASCVGVLGLASHQHQETGHVVLPERTIIIQAALGIHSVLDVLTLFKICQIIRSVLIYPRHVILSGVRIVSVHGVPERIELTIHRVLGQPSKVEQRHEGQALGNEIQVLV